MRSASPGGGEEKTQGDPDPGDLEPDSALGAPGTGPRKEEAAHEDRV